mgnify:CR=1 FL=1
MEDEPIVFVLSGKRKSGKDFVAKKLKEILGNDNCFIITLSGPLKYEYAREHELDFDRLLDSTDYKERYRVDMIHWGEKKRSKEPDYFCKKATKIAMKHFNGNASDSNRELKCGKISSCRRKVWIVSDARRTSDLSYFQQNFKSTITVRIIATDEVRACRGWVFKEGVDDAESECGLDKENFDLIIENNDSEEKLEQSLKIMVFPLVESTE